MGLVGLTRVLAVEGARYSIQANAIAPLALHPDDRGHHRRARRQARPGARHADRRLPRPRVVRRPPGRIFSCGGGRVAEVFIAETEGYYNPT